MTAQASVLNVYMNQVLVGKLEKTKSGGLRFAYDPNWLSMKGARPISLSLPLVEQPFTGDLVYHFFDNLLPDNPQIRSRIQAKFQVATHQAFDLLASIGMDCIGAISLVNGELKKSKKQIVCDPLTEKDIARILRGYKDYPLGMMNIEDAFRISIAGAQEKSAFLYYQGKWNRPLGATPTTHIFKLPIGYLPHQQIDLSDSCENEWLCAEIARAFGLSVAKSEICYFEDVKVLVVERFDRMLSPDKKWMMRLPQEDMCQALGISSHLKYQSDGGPAIVDIMQLLLGSSQANIDREHFFRSQVLFWLLAAIDGHAKNFSIFLEPEGRYHSTPLYDIISAYPLITKKELDRKKIKMAMALRGKSNHYLFDNAQRRYFMKTAKNAHFSEARAEEILDDMLEQVESVIEQVSMRLPKSFPDEISSSIFEGMRQSKLRFIKVSV